MIAKRILVLLLMCIMVSGFTGLTAQDMVTVHPREYPDALSNPLKGFRPDPDRAGNPKFPYPTIVRDYIAWNQIENDASDGVQKIIDYCNKEWKNYENLNVKVIPRVFLDWDWNAGNENWPADLEAGDWTSDEFKERVVKLVYKLGQAWDNDPRVAWVQTGIIGYWGEQENPVSISDDGWDKRLGDAFTNAFQNKKLVVRNQNDWPDYEMGVYWDSFGHPGQRPWAWTQIRKINEQGRYLTQIVEGEVAYNWGEDVFVPLYGAEPDITLNNYEYTNNMIDVIRELHCTGLGWIASYNMDGSYGTDPDSVRANASRVQKAFGYRFVIPEFSCSSYADPGGSLDLDFKVKNVGSAPFYEKWSLAFVLVDESSQEIVWTETLPDVDVTAWHPGADYDFDARTYETPAQEYVVNATVQVPSHLAAGQYMAGITILEPFSQTPGVFFAVENFINQSQTQPLCRIGIGQDVAGGHEIDPSIFGDPVNDNARFYTLTPQGDSFQLTTVADNGTILPSGGAYLPGTAVTLTAEGDLGYDFESWGGDLSGSENPVTITMDADKTITATFVAVPTYTLSTTAENGSVEFKPKGGLYEQGTTVKLTAVPEFGYEFSSWSGDLSGTDNPATILMNTDKNVTANFTPVPTYTITADAVNGSIKLQPDGGLYEKGTVVTVRAIPDFRYKFKEWGGDLLGSTNPATITMDADKQITATFTYIGGGDIVFATNCGGTAYKSSEGVEYSADMNNNGGSAYSTGNDIAETVDDILYQTERYGGTFEYNVELPNGDYEVTLMFAEIFHSSAGKRVFNVALEKENVISELDIWSWVGKNAPLNEIFPVTINDGELNIAFSTVSDNAKISAIKVVGNATHVEDIVLPLQTQLGHNYPNPFNPETTIPYQLSHASHVRLCIYNSVGQHVITLVDEQQTAGYHSIAWNGYDTTGNQLASGLYFYQLNIGDHSVQTQKFILAR